MKRLVSLVLALVLIAGCSSNTATGGTSATAAPTDGGTSETSGTFTVGMECNYAPFNWSQTEASDTAKEISSVDYCDGYDVVMATRIAESMGKEVVIKRLDWDNLIPALNAGDIDAIIAGMTDTPERRESVDFTQPYYESDMVVIVKGDSDLVNITNIQELTGRKVLGQLNTLYDDVIDQIEGVTHVTPQESYPRMVVSLQAGEVDALTAELPVANGVVSANPDLAIVQFEAGNGFEADTSVSVAVRKDSQDLLNAIQEALDTISQDERNTIMQEAINRQPANE